MHPGYTFNGVLTIEGPGSLAVDIGNVTVDYKTVKGLNVGGTFTIDGATVNATVGDVTGLYGAANGIHSSGRTVVQNGGNLSGVAGKAPYESRGLSIAGGSLEINGDTAVVSGKTADGLGVGVYVGSGNPPQNATARGTKSGATTNLAVLQYDFPLKTYVISGGKTVAKYVELRNEWPDTPDTPPAETPPPAAEPPVAPPAATTEAPAPQAPATPQDDVLWQDLQTRLIAGGTQHFDANGQDTANGYVPGFILDALRTGGGSLVITWGGRSYTITAAMAAKLAPGTNYTFEQLARLAGGGAPQTGDAASLPLAAGTACAAAVALLFGGAYMRRRKAGQPGAK